MRQTISQLVRRTQEMIRDPGCCNAEPAAAAPATLQFAFSTRCVAPAAAPKSKCKPKYASTYRAGPFRAHNQHHDHLAAAAARGIRGLRNLRLGCNKSTVVHRFSICMIRLDRTHLEKARSNGNDRTKASRGLQEDHYLSVNIWAAVTDMTTVVLFPIGF